MSRRALVGLSLLVVLRQALAWLHGEAHDALAVPLAPWQDVYVLVWIAIAPFVALAALWKWPTRASLAALAAVIAAGMLFALYFHFGPMNPDHVSHQPRGASADLFFWTAVGLGAIDAAILAACALAARNLPPSPKRYGTPSA